MIYERRKVPTRARAAWYRAPTLTGNEPDASHAADQVTGYETSDSPGATGDNPVSEGSGSRHNYTVIGDVAHKYDYNRNLIEDGTRNFRYNYLNQLRRVTRKSDKAKVAEYGEDAFGRRLLAKTHWELARRVYFDTRFELDVNGDAAAMKLVDGGITSIAAGPGFQHAVWKSLAPISNEGHHFDYLVDIPAVSGPTPVYLGYISYEDPFGTEDENYAVHIWSDRLESGKSPRETLTGKERPAPPGALHPEVEWLRLAACFRRAMLDDTDGFSGSER